MGFGAEPYFKSLILVISSIKNRRTRATQNPRLYGIRDSRVCKNPQAQAWGYTDKAREARAKE
jgi:hypothetical protein